MTGPMCKYNILTIYFNLSQLLFTHTGSEVYLASCFMWNRRENKQRKPFFILLIFIIINDNFCNYFVHLQGLQKAGKHKATKDDIFELYQTNFINQQEANLKLQKEIKNYIQCARGEWNVWFLILLWFIYSVQKK